MRKDKICSSAKSGGSVHVKGPRILVTTIGMVVHSFSDGLALGSTIYAAGQN